MRGQAIAADEMNVGGLTKLWYGLKKIHQTTGAVEEIVISGLLLVNYKGKFSNIVFQLSSVQLVAQSV